MELNILKALLENAAILIVAFLLLTRLKRWEFNKTHSVPILTQGLAYALCGLLALVFSVEVVTGVLIDMRVPIIVVASFFGGFYVGLISIIPLVFFRIFLGGSGMVAGLALIFTSMVFGLILRNFSKRKKYNFGILAQAIIGIFSALLYLLWMLALPSRISIIFLYKTTAVPLIVISTLTILSIFYLRKKELEHQELLSELRKKNNFFEEIATNNNIGILVLKNKKIEYINTPILEKCGYYGKNMDNINLYSLLSNSTKKQFNLLLKKVNSGSFSEPISIEITLQNNHSFTQLVHAKQFLYEEHETIIFVAVDITKLSETEKTLQSKLDQLELALNAFNAVVWKANILEDKLIAGNDFFDLLAYTPPELPPKFSNWLIEMELSTELNTAFSQLKAGNINTLTGELNYTGDKLHKKWFNLGVKTSSFSKNGKPKQISGILFETTIFKEKAMNYFNETIENLQSQKMEAIGRLAGGIAHDFNNILHVIMGYSDILVKISEKDPVYSDLCKPIVEASNKGSELIKQLLIFSRDEKAKLQCINLTDLVTNFTKLLSRIMEQNITIATSINTDNTFIYGDSVQIEQVLMNLCVNSRDAMPYGGNISITLDEIVIGSRTQVNSGTIKPGTYGCLTIRDEGTGIPKNIQKTIFDPFFTTKKPDKGTGLGLATVLCIVKDHSGYIDLQNLPTNGIEFKIYLPKLRQSQMNNSLTSTTELASSSIVNNNPICILLAEDSPQIMKLTVEGLGASGIQTFKATNGKEAIELYVKHKDKIDMLVFDVIMPELDGPSAYEEIKKLGYSKPILFATGYHGDRLSIIDQSYDVINKPYTMSSLASKIRELIGEQNDKH